MQFTTTVIVVSTLLSWFHPAPHSEGDWNENIAAAVLWATAAGAVLTAAVILLLAD